MELYLVGMLDPVVVLTCAIVLWKYGRVSALHPGPVYLLFHILVVSWRVDSVLGGSSTLFSTWGHGALPVGQDELAWAATLADVALMVMTAAWVKVAADDRRRHPIPRHDMTCDATAALLSERGIWIVGAIAAPIGVIALFYFGNTGEAGVYKVDLGDWNSSSWTMVTQSWTGLVLLSLIYYYGFRKVLMVPMGCYLLVMAVQGFDRFRVILPLLYLLFVWLSRTGRKWPPLWMAGAAFGVLLLFFPMKTIGNMVQRGQPISDIADVTSNIVSDVTSGRADDQLILDEFASTMSLVDNSHRYFYGTLYYPLLTVAIPKQWWGDKPAVNWYMREISTPSRPMARAGMVPTLLGESYANFGITGIIIVTFMSAYYLGRFYFTAMRSSYVSVYRFSYIMVACTLIQVFRDGLISLFMFTLVNMSPLVVIAVLSWFSFRRSPVWRYAPARIELLRGKGAGGV